MASATPSFTPCWHCKHMRSFDVGRNLAGCAIAVRGCTNGREGCSEWERAPGLDDQDEPFDFPPKLPELPKREPWRPVSRDGWWTEPPRPRRAAAAAKAAPAARAVIRLFRLSGLRCGRDERA